MTLQMKMSEETGDLTEDTANRQHQIKKLKKKA